MIFIVKESVMNGTVTISTTVFGVEADTFLDAAFKLQRILTDRLPSATITLVGSVLSYSVPTNVPFPIVGSMDNTPLEMLEVVG